MAGGAETYKTPSDAADDDSAEFVLAPEDWLRALPPEIETEPEATEGGAGEALAPPTSAVTFKVEPQGEPQERGTRYYAVDQSDGHRVYTGKVTVYGTRRGLGCYSGDIRYDRMREEQNVGLWAHFIWPTAMGESEGCHIVVNAWDRARFTWGFYQLAAHTANENLILLMRELLKLPAASFYFPDLVLSEGKVARRSASGAPVSLEREVWSAAHRETQLPDFMSYLNLTDTRVENGEVATSARFIDWARRDPEMLATTIRVSVDIMKRRLRGFADAYGLRGRRAELAIWVSDMFHQGRGSPSQVRAALRLPTFEEQLAALSRIDTTGNFATRRATVDRHVRQLIAEHRFDGDMLGEGALVLEEAGT